MSLDLFCDDTLFTVLVGNDVNSKSYEELEAYQHWLVQQNQGTLLLDLIIMVTYHRMQDDGIIDLLYANPELEFINLENCNISNRTLQKIGAICTNLKTLIIARCTTINDGGIENLVAGSKTLRKLDLTGLNLIGDRVSFWRFFILNPIKSATLGVDRNHKVSALFGAHRA
jgi:hypothetical protein